VELYRDSIEIIPGDFAADIEVLESASAMPEPTAISIVDNENNTAIIGQLNVLEGTVTRIEEQTYDYQVDLTDELGNTTLVLIEKDTGVTAEPLDLGQLYRVTGISEFYSTERQIKPRLQSDIVQVFPPVLLLEMRSSNSILPGETISYTITAYNHTPDPLTNLHITAQPPERGITVEQIQDGGTFEGETIVWTIDQLEGNGASAEVHYTAIVQEGAADSFFAPPATATADEWTDPASSESFFTFIGSGVPIWAIQGDGVKSPYARIKATTEGIVTGVFPEFQGFWMQELETDDDPATSAGLFVLVDGMDESGAPVEPGDLVRVTGRVREISGQTTLHATAPTDIELLHAGTSPPVPASYDPPLELEEALAYKESLEGMLVTLGEAAIAVGPTTRYGEYALVNEHWDVDTVQRGEEAGFLIFVDDGSSVTHLDQSTLPYAVQRGDVVTSLSGPLAYTFGQHKIEPLATPEIDPAGRELPTIPAAGPDELSIASFNVENLFDLLDPHPSSPPMPTIGEYRLKLGKLAEAIIALGAPAIIGLQEVENIDVLEDLVEEEQIADLGYVPFLIEGPDSRGIDVAYLVRGDLITVDGVASYPAPEGLTSRPPLVISTTVHLDSGDTTLYLLNNHFSSLSSGEEATEPRRTAQAAWNATLVEKIRAADPEGHIVVMGDLNSFYGTPPIDVLQEAGLRHAYEFFEAGETLPYTYIFQGATQSLDHILVSEDLYSRLLLVAALHIDADYPIGDPDDATARHVSDHDPLIVIFSFSED
jgi:uncharacterized repeat protein (TIGR01451 family)